MKYFDRLIIFISILGLAVGVFSWYTKIEKAYLYFHIISLIFFGLLLFEKLKQRKKP
ncbi:hypothetical protein V7S79_07180 [Aquirufa sp. ROCK-SH2]